MTDSNKTLEQLTPADPLSGDELIYLVQNGNSRRITVDDLATLINGFTVQQGIQSSFRGVVLRSPSGIMNGTGNPAVPPYTEDPATAEWDSAEIDTDSFWTAAFPTRIVIPPGITKVRLGFSLTTIGNHIKASVVKNGEDMPGQAYASSSQATDHRDINGERLSCSAWTPVLSVVAGDFFEVRAQSNDSFGANFAGFFTLEVVEVVAT